MKHYLLITCFLFFSYLFCWSQPITLTFTGRDAKNQSIPLNRVVITNLTQNWQETIYYPDTILILGSTGIGDFDNSNEFKLSQNVPNPFDGITDFSLQLPNSGKVTLEVFDLNGKKITDYHGKLQAGVHTFRVLLNTTQSYLLTARCGSDVATIKMVNNGSSGENAIHYLGEGCFYPLTATLKGGTNKPFAFGDNMMYIGFATINGIEYISQTIEQRQILSETFVLNFEATNILLPVVITDTISNVTFNSAVCGGNVISDGGDTVTAKGVCWNTEPLPTIANAHTSDGTGVGTFTSTITGLMDGSMYYVRAYAVNGAGVAYGEQQTFTTSKIAPPTVNTADISGITRNSAFCGGTVVDKGTAIIARGVCWSTSHNPTINDYHTSDGDGAGSFTSTIENLTSGTLYYVRAYAIAADSIFYGEEKSFTTTTAQLPVVVTNEITNIAITSASCGYTVIDMGTYVTARGVCWSTSPNPTISDEHTTDGIGAGTFTSEMTNLQEATDYYIRAYATNGDGTTYGEERLFTTLGGRPCATAPTVTDYDGNVYNTVQIGDQCWMKENLRTTKYSDGTEILQGSESSSSVPYWYYPNNNSSNKSTYGLLYNWKAVMRNAYPSTTNPSNVQGICPDGWHVPSDAEWTQLTDYVSAQGAYQCSGKKTNIARALASNTGWGSSTNTCAVGNSLNNNNETGFDAFPSGGYSGGSNFYLFGKIFYVWSSTEYSSDYSFYMELYYDNANIIKNFDSKCHGLSVRCLKDDEHVNDGQPCPGTSTITDIDGNTYNTVQIGDQCWMKENLRTTKYADKTYIELGSITSTSTAYRYYPDNNPGNIPAYGYLYNWKAIMRNSSSSPTNPSGVQGICPMGWHVPSKEEWTQLFNYVLSQSRYQCDKQLIGKAFASTEEWKFCGSECTVGNSQNNNNGTGFSVLPAGSFYDDNSKEFSLSSSIGSATEFNSSESYWFTLTNTSHSPYIWSQDKFFGISVRCLKD